MSQSPVPASRPVAALAAALPDRATITLAGEALALTGHRSVWWPAAAALLVADLHLDKGATLARAGGLIPAYDTVETLGRLEALVDRFRPAVVICLGDTLHRRDGWDHLPVFARDRLLALVARVPSWTWIAGNHDPAGPAPVGQTAATLALGPFLLTHEPPAAPDPAGRAVLCGHLHPKARLPLGPRQVSAPCFAQWPDLLILPAFGAFTGGLWVEDPAIAGLRPTPPHLTLAWRGHAIRVPRSVLPAAAVGTRHQ